MSAGVPEFEYPVLRTLPYPERIREETDLHALADLLRQKAEELVAVLVVADDVVLDQNGLLGRSYIGHHVAEQRIPFGVEGDVVVVGVRPGSGVLHGTGECVHIIPLRMGLGVLLQNAHLPFRSLHQLRIRDVLGSKLATIVDGRSEIQIEDESHRRQEDQQYEPCHEHPGIAAFQEEHEEQRQDIQEDDHHHHIGEDVGE